MTKIFIYILLGIALLLNIISLTLVIYRAVKINKKTKQYEVTIKDKWNNVDFMICHKYRVKKNKLYLYNVNSRVAWFDFLKIKIYNLTYIANYEIKDIS